MADQKKTPAEIKAENERAEFTKKNAKALTEQNKISSEQSDILKEIKSQLANESRDSVGKLKKLLDSQTNKLGKDRFTDAQKKQLTDQFGLEQLGVGRADAAQRVAANTELEKLQQEKERLEGVKKEFGMNAVDETELKALESDIQSLEEVKKFGRTLSKFERGFQTFASGTIEELIQATKDGGALTAKGMADSFGNDLKNDFDKVLSLFGPVVGLLQQIPLLGTILNLAKTGLKRLFVELFLSRKSSVKLSKKEVKAQKETSKMLGKELKFQTKMQRREAREKQKERMKKGMTGAKAGDQITQKKAINPLLVSSITLLIATMGKALGAIGAGIKMIGMGIGGFLKSFAGGLAAFGLPALKGAAILAAALVLVGGAIGLGGLMAMKGIQAGLKDWDKHGLPELFKKLSDPAIKPWKITGLLMGLGLGMAFLGVGGLIQTITTWGGKATPLTNLGKDLGGFSKNLHGFDKLDSKKLLYNIGVLAGTGPAAGLSGLITNIFSGFGLSKGFTNLGKDLGGFANNVKPFMQMDMPKFKSQIKQLTEALNAIHFPSFSSFLQSQGLLHNIRRLSNIEFQQPTLGEDMQKLGTGVQMISSGIDSLTVEKAKALGRLGYEISRNFDDITMQFGVIPQTAGAGNSFQVNNTPAPSGGTTVNTVAPVSTTHIVKRENRYIAKGSYDSVASAASSAWESILG